MWTCPMCKESIEDNFDSCWRCAGQESPPPRDERFWLYPVCSFLALLVCGPFIPLYIQEPRNGPTYFSVGGALLSIVVGIVCLRAFACCPYRHWFVKILTTALLLLALCFVVVAVGSFLIHVVHEDAA